MEELGARLKTSKASVNNWEKGVNLPNKQRLKKIAELGGITVNELLYGDAEYYFFKEVSCILDNLKNKEDYHFINLMNTSEINDLKREIIKEVISYNYSYGDTEEIKAITMRHLGLSNVSINKRESYLFITINLLKKEIEKGIYFKELTGSDYEIQTIQSLIDKLEKIKREVTLIKNNK